MKKLILFTLTVLVFISCRDKNIDYLVNIKTSMGTMKVLLYDETPLHKKNFLMLAKEGKYDSTIFHRVIEDFMIQGGDIYRKEGTSETEEALIPAEIVKGLYHTKGTLAAARTGDNINPERKSSSCQFYIVDGNSWDMLSTDINLCYQKLGELFQQPDYENLKNEFAALQNDPKAFVELVLANRSLVEEKFGISLRNPNFKTVNDDVYKNTDGSPHLDQEYTVFGRVVEGLEVIDKLAAVQKNGSSPTDPLYLFMEIEEMKKKDVTALYGYEYPAAE